MCPERLCWVTPLRISEIDPTLIDPIDPGRSESARSDPDRSESDRSDLDRSDPDRSDPNRSNPDRSDPDRSDPGQSDPDRFDPDRFDSGRSDPDRSDPERLESDQSDPDRSDPNLRFKHPKSIYIYIYFTKIRRTSYVLFVGDFRPLTLPRAACGYNHYTIRVQQAGSMRPQPLYTIWVQQAGSRQECRGNLFIVTFKCHYVVHSYMSCLCFIPYWTGLWCNRQAGRQ